MGQVERKPQVAPMTVPSPHLSEPVAVPVAEANPPTEIEGPTEHEDSEALAERIRTLAYEMWESEGRPDGHHERHWDEAERAVRPAQ